VCVCLCVGGVNLMDDKIHTHSYIYIYISILLIVHRKKSSEEEKNAFVV